MSDKENFWDREKTKIATEGLIEFCRKQEISFRKLESNYSGVEYLSRAVIEGVITMDDYIQILPAISNPYAPYELTS
ncbi:hypothetical protein DX873_15920 [Flagellimonas nanhaiensis]|uniref:Uncharacterized protein n=2 Tax=Flagellimonas nanhaiensis TaxID=2292706 RepID=A0A371JLS1_9FLAO|nr:hypothetical protein DX873_15920 [Allomuricauda nanhaiensis]